MPLDMNKLKRIQSRLTEMHNELRQGGEWKPDAGTYEMRFMEIQNAPAGIFYEYNTHNYPGEKQGFEYCGRAVDQDCILCDVIENNADTDDATFARLLEELSPPKNGRIAFLVCIKPQNGEWMGPFIWKARMDQAVKFQPLFSGKWGDPTTRNFEVTFSARKKTFKGYKILDVETVLPTHDGVSPMPIHESKLKSIDVVRRLHPRGAQEIWDKLMDTAIGPYLREMPERSESPAEEQVVEEPVEEQPEEQLEAQEEIQEEAPPPPPPPVRTVVKKPVATIGGTPRVAAPVAAPVRTAAPAPAGGGSVVDKAKSILAARKAGG